MSRQFVDMSRIRIEGLLAAFPKLVGSGKQHTYVETENVRYVYQPMEARILKHTLAAGLAVELFHSEEVLRTKCVGPQFGRRLRGSVCCGLQTGQFWVYSLLAALLLAALLTTRKQPACAHCSALHLVPATTASEVFGVLFPSKSPLR